MKNKKFHIAVLWQNAWTIRIISIIVFLIIWELFGRKINPVFISHPTAIAKAFYKISIASPILLTNLKISLLALLYGFGISVVIGIPFGLLMGRIRVFEHVVDPFVNAIYATPRIVFIPLIILWFGIALKAKIVLIILLAIFPIIINTYSGVKNVERSLIDAARVFGGSQKQVLFKIILPASIPFIMAGIRLSIGMAIIGVILGEMFTALTGLGGLLVTYANRFATDKVFSVIIVIAILGIGLTELVKWLGRRIAPWKEISEG